ncbi:MAG TPA: hypothetical protein VFF63_07325 [Candidatus Babeliales bacterium]|nr:hypothetical protein [Candidatus Babeliales bacterium]
MRRFPIEIFIVVICAVMLVLGWRIYGTGEMGRFGPAIHAQHAPSELYARMLVRYPKPPIFEEEYRMSDIEGVSKFYYRIRGYDGRQITVSAPPARVYDVSFFFGKLGQDGIWDLVNKPPLPNASARYTVYVKQLADYKQGERTVTFTDPQYWALKAGQQYEIDLSKGVPKDLVHIESQQAGDAQYVKIVADFRDFGPDEFKHNVEVAQARIRGVHG